MPPPITLSKPARKPTGPPKPKKPLAAFAAADSDHDSDSDQGGAFATASKSKKLASPSKPGNKPKPNSDIRKVNAQLATFDALSRKAAESAATAATEVDPSIFDYDAAWEDMKAVDRHKKALDEADAAERKPKYMENLLQSAEIRKRDQLRAKEKLLQREREAEGEEFKDKESFVTEAYKKQQEELLKLEEEERIREENLRKKSQGMSTFHRNMLNKMESKHDLVVAAAEHKVSLPTATTATDDSTVPETDLERRARELRERGAAIDVNEEGQVVDKTQLLSGGLNVVAVPKKPGPGSASSHPPDIRKQQPGWQGKSKRQLEEERRARQTRMLEEQLAQAQKREAEEEVEKMRELERAAKSRKTETDVMSAKERYLARKRAAEEAKKKGGES